MCCADRDHEGRRALIALWTRIEQALEQRQAIDASVADPELSPWALCTLVALARHRARQEWVGEIVRTHLGGDPEEIARRGAFGHPEHIEQLGDTPGLPGWTYVFHGRGCCLTHAETGESIDVDFGDGGRADVIDPYFFAAYLRSLRRPEPVEACLIALHPSFRTVTVSIDELVERGLVTRRPTVLTEEARAHERLLHSVGDRLIHVGPLATETLARRRTWLLARDREDVAGGPLRALAETAPDDLATHLRSALEAAPADGRTSTAIDIITESDDPAYCPAVWALFARLDPGGAIPQPHLWAGSARFLLRHTYSVDAVIATLADAGGAEVGEAALLALEFAPRLGRPLLKKALRSSVPLCRGVAAATLALIEQDWAAEELHALLSETTDEGLTSECRAALRSLGDPRGACSRWERANSSNEIVDGAPMTVDQLVIVGTDERVRDEIERLRERVARVTSRSAPS